MLVIGSVKIFAVKATGWRFLLCTLHVYCEAGRDLKEMLVLFLGLFLCGRYHTMRLQHPNTLLARKSCNKEG